MKKFLSIMLLVSSISVYAMDDGDKDSTVGMTDGVAEQRRGAELADHTADADATAGYSEVLDQLGDAGGLRQRRHVPTPNEMMQIRNDGDDAGSGMSAAEIRERAGKGLVALRTALLLESLEKQWDRIDPRARLLAIFSGTSITAYGFICLAQYLFGTPAHASGLWSWGASNATSWWG